MQQRLGHFWRAARRGCWRSHGTARCWLAEPHSADGHGQQQARRRGLHTDAGADARPESWRSDLVGLSTHGGSHHHLRRLTPSSPRPRAVSSQWLLRTCAQRNLASAVRDPSAGASRRDEGLQRCCARWFRLGARARAVASRGDGTSVCKPSRWLFRKKDVSETGYRRPCPY